MKNQKRFWIKERHNPQLGVYYVPCGQLSNTAAMLHESPRYGENIMHPYQTEEEYQSEIKRLREAGESVQ